MDNSHQFTKALTIGYWKTHAPASCKQGNGNQDDSLSAALGSGISLGSYLLTDPCKAVNLLQKESINGKKQPGDPIFNMVAQLVAAELNVNDGAGGCTASTQAISDANTLLTAIHFNGLTYDTLTSAQVTQANNLNTALDAYNNNTLC